MGNVGDIRKNSFSNVICDYEYARPKYPQEINDTICNYAKLQMNADILEIGAGTGQATELFLNKGYNLNLVEVSVEQVDYLKNKYENYNVSVVKAYFEDYISDKQYDLIYSATAFHWIKSEIGYPKAWEMLKPGGTMAVFWQMSSVTYNNDGIFAGLNELKKKYLPQESLGFDTEGIQKVKEKRINQIQSGGCFGKPETYEFRWTDTYDADRYVALVNSYSSTQLMEEKVRKNYLYEVRQLISENGGKVEMPQFVMLYLVRK